VVVQMALWFGISTPAAVVRLTQADILQRPADRKRLDAAIKRGTHKGIEKLYASEMPDDALAKIAARNDMPRLPVRMRKNALAAYAAGVIDIDRLATIMRRDVGTVRDLVESVGIVPAAETPDW